MSPDSANIFSHGACRASFLVPSLPPVPGGAAARVGDEPAEASAAPGAKRARHAE